MLYLFGLLLAWTSAAMGWGGLLVFPRKWLGVKSPYAYDIVEPIFGLVLVTVIANVLNFWMPLGQVLSLIVLVLGWVLLLWRLSKVPSILESPIWIGLGILWVAAVSTHAGWRVYNSDSGLYHVPAMRWLVSSEIPLGLGNLHGRLAFNSSWFSVSAVLAQAISPYTWHYAGLASYVLLILFGFVALSACKDIIAARGRVGPAPLFIVCAALIGITPIVRENLSSPSTDHPSLLLVLLTVFLSLRAISALDSATFDYNIWFAFLLGLYSTTVKLSTVILLVIPLALLLLRYGRQLKPKIRVLTLAALVVLVLFIPWLGRNLALSGCLIYPVRQTCITALPWTVPLRLVDNEARWVSSWARAPRVPQSEVLGSWNWLGPWFDRITSSNDLRIPLTLLAIGILLVGVSAKFIFKQSLSRSVAVILVGCLLGLTYWFLTAPDLRFGVSWIWAITVLVLAVGLWGVSQRGEMRYVLIALAAVLILAGAYGIYDKGIVVYSARSLKLDQYLNYLAGLPTPQIETQKTRQGITINIATDTNCWWTNMCTPYFNENMHIRTLPDGRLLFSAPD